MRNPEELYQALVLSPASVLVRKYGASAGLDIKEYSLLTECHCVSEFSRQQNNFRDYSEQYLVEVAKTFGDDLNIVIIGSGNFLQTTIILAKLAQLRNYQNLQINLIDPHNHSEDHIDSTEQFISLLSTLGFRLNIPQAYTMPLYAGCIKYLCSSDDIDYLDYKSNITILFHQKSKPEIIRAADTVFINDVPIELDDLNATIQNCKIGAFCITARKIRKPVCFQWQPTSGTVGHIINFELKYKTIEGTWTDIIKTHEPIYPIINIQNWLTEYNHDTYSKVFSDINQRLNLDF